MPNQRAATPPLTDFLLARIAEDEARGRAAIADDMGSDEGFAGQYDILRRPPSGVGIASGGFGDAAARMIATYAVPARVLAECEAKRRIVERHGRCGTGMGYCDDGGHGWGGEDGLGCADLADLATIYADHPDYREKWRPDA